MYEKYTTDAVVMRTQPIAEADVLAVLYTKEFGLIRARATSARAAHSKMRSALITGALVSATLVKGRVGWRLAGVEAQGIALPIGAYAVCGRVFRLLQRLVHGEEKHSYLFETLHTLRIALMSAPKETYPTLELVSVARLLYALGYISSESVGTALFAETALGEGEIAAAERERIKLLGAVNGALAASQL